MVFREVCRLRSQRVMSYLCAGKCVRGSEIVQYSFEIYTVMKWLCWCSMPVRGTERGVAERRLR
jgi:hypothetical protein